MKAKPPYIEIRKDQVISHNEDNSYKISSTVDSLILAKILFELELINLRLEGKLKE